MGLSIAEFVELTRPGEGSKFLLKKKYLEQKFYPNPNPSPNFFLYNQKNPFLVPPHKSNFLFFDLRIILSNIVVYLRLYPWYQLNKVAKRIFPLDSINSILEFF